jgi:spoIIIJ-associated protein
LTKEEAVGETLTLEEQGESAREFVAGLIDELGLSAQVSTRLVDDETAEVVVEGQELGVLVGPGGATLAALQELARTFVQKRTGGQSSRIVVDVAGYRAKRTAALQKFATQIAEEVSASGSERALEPMTASDRKVVHDTINEIDGLATRSEGEEPRRYIVISSQRPVTGGSATSDIDEVETAEGA